MKLRVEIARWILRIAFNMKYKFVITETDFDRKRKEPYFLIANHAAQQDPLYIGMYLKHYPYPVASNILYIDRWTRFGLTHIVHGIPKRKGQSDAKTIRMMLQAFNKDQRGIMIFPEGNSSYFGKETETDFIPTAKIVKKIQHDVVVAKLNGGYFSAPRWGEKRKRPQFHIHFHVLIKKHELNDLSIEEIAAKMKEALKFNDYEWNKVHQFKYKSKTKAHGLEHYIYSCPKCHSLQTIKTKGNDVSCSNCGHLATFNDYHLLEGLSFDNLIEWDQLQKQDLKNHDSKVALPSHGSFYEIDLIYFKKQYLGCMNTLLDENGLKVFNDKITYQFDLKLLSGLVLTQKNVLSFDYEDKTYMLKLQDPMIYIDFIHLQKGV